MGTISDKLMRIINTKEDIRRALISKGYDVPTSIPFKEYAKMILDLPCRVDSFPDIEGIVARYSALGLTNEQMAENPIWKDLTGNGHDLQMKNFAWKGMSGVGGYTENYDSDRWYKVTSRIDTTWTYKSFNVKSIKDNNSAQLFYQSRPSDTGFRVLSCTIKVSGLTDGQGIEYISNGTRPVVIMRIENDGIYHLPSFDFGAKNAYYGFKFLKLQESCNITIEQLPLYSGALVFDGVDDYGTCNNFPILTKEKGYTVVALRQWLSFQDIGYPTLVVNSTDRLAAFSFEDFRSKTKSTWNWGRSVGLSDYKIPLLYTYQTSTSYNSKTIYAGATEEGSNILQVCRSGIYCANAAIWEIVILDHDATEEELTKIKDYFVKTYPWLFPDQAWTVTGKTNEDEDRATIANITGNGNDLVLSNFGFAEGSGYGLYAENYSNSRWFINNSITGTKKSDTFNVTSINQVAVQIQYIAEPSQSPYTVPSYTIKVTGLTDGQTVNYRVSGGISYPITQDGIYILPGFDFAGKGSWYGFQFNKVQESCDITIEQIPEYEGYLITDGVDDKVTSVNAVTLNKDFTVVGEWRFKETEIRSNCGIVVERVLFVYNIPTGIRIYIHEVGGNFTELQNIKSLKAICSNGIVYDENWNPISVKVGSLEEYSNKLLLGYLSNLFTQIAFKNMSIYSNQVLSKDDCIKAYNYLQTLKSK